MPLPQIPDAALTRFHADVEALVGEPERIGIAVSGGPDSLALLLLGASAYPGRISAATVDHGLRPESASEAAHVAAVCQAIGVPHTILKVKVPSGGEGLQGEARRARYMALKGWCEDEGNPLLATAHHTDDQAETFLMRLARGAGLSGLSGVRPIRKDGPFFRVIRPLLAWRRHELTEIVRNAGIEAVDDPSNRDSRFDRVRIRQFLAKSPLFDPVRIVRSASALRDCDDAIAWIVGHLWQEKVNRTENEISFSPQGLPREILRRLTARSIASLAGAAHLPRGDEISSLISHLSKGETATLAGVKCIGGATWTFKPAPPRRGGHTSS